MLRYITLEQLQKNILAVLLGGVFFIIAISITGFFNPDWIVYERIFNDGSHLKDDGRDLGYLVLNNIFKLFSTDYTMYRNFLAVFFSFFIFHLIKGNILNYKFQQKNVIILCFFVLSFLCVRFTIQIREGLAICFLISAINDVFILDSLDTKRKIGARNFILYSKLLIMYFMHSGTSLFIILIVLAEIITKFHKRESKILFSTYYDILLFAVLILAISFSFLYKYLIGNVYFLKEDDQLTTNTLNLSKILYWVFNGIIMIILVKKVGNFCRCLKKVESKSFFLLISHFILPFLYTLIFTSIIINAPSGLLAALSRLYNLALCICVMLLCLKSNKHKLFTFTFSTFLIVDQIRIVIESLKFHELI